MLYIIKEHDTIIIDWVRIGIRVRKEQAHNSYCIHAVKGAIIMTDIGLWSITEVDLPNVWVNIIFLLGEALLIPGSR